MTDRELLELAAKAAGWTWWRSKHGYWNIKGPDCKERAACCGWFKFDAYTGSEFAEPTPADALIEVGFNPLDDDGDAFRLAVRLKLSILLRPYRVEILGWPETTPEPLGFPNTTSPEVFSMEAYADDHCTATRRAIVRAAAEIGRAM